ncbi:uncharacterized protein LOC115635282 [Gopherus evgoodei]|uniref:uncharacterized protein LOC115635282 n=1 Tax=Gopherus evgoodei TaxID=1825980 RepID=UPI0011CF58FF|nr:uncharacterized protein LOC115635282 [Gopherus evgoodei]
MCQSQPSGERDQINLSLVQRIEFIRALLDSTRATASLPLDRFKALRGLIASVTAFLVTTAEACLQILGHIVACTYVVYYARLRMRPLQLWLASQFSQARDGLIRGPHSFSSPILSGAYPSKMLQGVPFWEANPSGPGDQCVGPGLGSPHRQHANPGDVVDPRLVPSHKCQGAQGNTVGVHGLPHAPSRQGGQGSHRQLHSHVLHQQARRDSLPNPLLGSPQPMGVLYSPRYLPEGCTPQQAFLLRVRVVAPLGHSPALPRVGCSPDRPLCNPPEPMLSLVLLQGRSGERRAIQCILPTVVGPAPLRFPAIPSY